VDPVCATSEWNEQSGHYIFCPAYEVAECPEDACLRLWVDNPGGYDPEVWWRFEQGPCCSDVYEDLGDNQWYDGPAIYDGETQIHSIDPVGDVDWVSFELAGRSRVVIETSGGSGDTHMWLYGAGPAFIEEDDDSGPGSFSRIDRDTCGEALPAGTYYVKITEAGDDDTICDYALTLSVAPCVPGDYNGDDTVGVDDYAVFADCLSGPGAVPTPPAPITVEECLGVFDFDIDEDVDLYDFDLLVLLITPP
jgi:hypothetical protein